MASHGHSTDNIQLGPNTVTWCLASIHAICLHKDQGDLQLGIREGEGRAYGQAEGMSVDIRARVERAVLTLQAGAVETNLQVIQRSTHRQSNTPRKARQWDQTVRASPRRRYRSCQGNHRA